MPEMRTGKTFKENIRDFNPLLKRELKSTMFLDDGELCSALNSPSQKATQALHSTEMTPIR